MERYAAVVGEARRAQRVVNGGAPHGALVDALGDVAHIEVNEAFAAQALAVAAELGVDAERLNAHGGAIALGHPLGASGARILGLLAHGLAADKGARYAVGSACIGGGQGVAVLLERA